MGFNRREMEDRRRRCLFAYREQASPTKCESGTRGGCLANKGTAKLPSCELLWRNKK
jgi:hypothetical protein